MEKTKAERVGRVLPLTVEMDFTGAVQITLSPHNARALGDHLMSSTGLSSLPEEDQSILQLITKQLVTKLDGLYGEGKWEKGAVIDDREEEHRVKHHHVGD